ncbi:MAG: type IV pilus assembly protein PilM [Candidatus Omnitrophica bacterium]|nr:type IV pilus assembly protein PilM [Candidatus Omnitrophota bacterium]
MCLLDKLKCGKFNMANIFSRIKLPVGKDKFSIGLDIGTQSIKAVKLKISGNSVELVAFDVEESQLDPIEVLKKIKHAQNADLVNISFCGSSTVIRYVNFLRMSKSELRQALKFEAQKHIPFSLEEVNLDAEILKDNLPDDKMLVLIAALKKEFIRERLKSLEGAGLRPNIVDIDSLALINAFNFNYPKVEILESKSICLLNIGATISNVNIIDNAAPRLSRDIHFGGANFTKKLMDIFSIDFKAAEELKLNSEGDGLPSDPAYGGADRQSHKPEGERVDKVKATVESVLTNLAVEIRTSFDYYESQNNSSVVKIFLSGGGSKITGFKEMLVSSLGIEVEFWDPFKQIKINDQLDAVKLNQIVSLFNIAVGLALR